MSVIWSGITEQGAIVPVQVTDEGKVVAASIDSGCLPLTGGNLTGDLTLGTDPQSPNITLSANGFAQAKGGFIAEQDSGYFFIGQSTGNVNSFLVESSGDVKIGGTLPSSPNITLSANGSATFDNNVGIGIDSPNAGLQVKSDSLGIPALGAAGTMQVGDGSSYGLMIGAANVGGTGYIQAQRSDGGAATYDLLLNPNGGNVGVGKSNAQATLDVDGSAAFTGDIECTDNTTGLILKSANGTRYRLFVDNTGFLSTSPA